MGIKDFQQEDLNALAIRYSWFSHPWSQAYFQRPRETVGRFNHIFRVADYGRKGNQEFKIRPGQQTDILNRVVEETISGLHEGYYCHAMVRESPKEYRLMVELRNNGLVIRKGYHYFPTVDGLRLYFKLKEQAWSATPEARLEADERAQYMKIIQAPVTQEGLAAWLEVK